MTGSGIRVGDGVAVSFQGDVVILMWKAASRAHRLAWLARELQSRSDLESFVVLQVILTSSSPPDGPANAEARRLLKSISGRMRRIVSVALGDSVWTSIVRAVMRAMVMVIGQSHLAVVTATVPEALGKIHEVRTEKTPSGTALLAACADVAAALHVQLPGLSGVYSAVDASVPPASRR